MKLPPPTARDEGDIDQGFAAAAKVLAFVDRADFGANPVADVREVS